MKRLICAVLAVLMLAGSLAIAANAAGVDFKDVPKDRWSYQYVRYATDKGYLKGVGGGLFDPEGTTTRAMVVTVLWRRDGSPATAWRSDFKDVPDGEWYSEPVIWAKDSGVVMGVSADRFDPDGEITREQLATMLCRYADGKHIYVGDRDDLSAFKDKGKISDWADDAVRWAVAVGLIAGVTSTTIEPGSDATREQLATILKRFDEKCVIKYAEPVLISHYTEKPYPLVEDADIYVSTEGDDSAAGTKAAPIRTFARAVEMVRDKKAAKETSVVVAFFAGDYGDPAVKMTAADSGTKDAPVIYCAYGDGDVVFSGGAIFDESEFSDLDGSERTMFIDRFADKIKKADMSVKYPEYSVTDVMFGDSGAMTVARYPNKYEDGSDNLVSQSEYVSSDNSIRIVSSLLTRRIPNYHTTEGLYLYGFLTTGWYKDLLETDSCTKKEDGYDFGIPHPEKARMGWLRFGEIDMLEEYSNVAFVNVSEELDAVGEYFVDPSTKTLYVYDPAGSYCFPKSEIAVNMDHTDYITFRGLTFTAYKESMIKADMCHGVTVDLCTVTKCAGDFAINIDGCAKGRDLDCAITNSYFSIFACRPIRVVGDCLGSHMFDRNGNVEIYNNFFSYSHLTKDDGCAVQLLYCSGAHVHHNEFEDIGRGAIDYGGCHDFLAEYNSFKRCMYNSQDGGVFYAWNRLDDWGNVIRYNVLYPTAWYGAYIDDIEAGTTIYGNILYDAVVVIHDGRSSSVKNNVLIDSGINVTDELRETVEEAKESGDIESIKDHKYYKQWESFFNDLYKYPDKEANFREKYPEVFDLSLDLADIDDPSFVLNPTNEVTGNTVFVKPGKKMYFEFEDAAAPFVINEDNTFYTMNENPIFVNPSAGDYRIRPDAGPIDIPFELMGRE
ncbi:MAG: S-layer homology domain-containing protein [Clostridia bacterium]|nr:S-layer homology domain-containing protein [Clostridia bacterium]